MGGIDEWTNKVTRDLPDKNNIVGFSPVTLKPLVDQGETNDFEFFINWGLVTFASISLADPNSSRPTAIRMGYLDLRLGRQSATVWWTKF